jgi:methionyl-tRNA formyltransferase
MNTPTNTSKPPQHRVLFFGTHGVYSYSVLAPLIERGVNIVNIVIPGDKPDDHIEDLGGIPIVQHSNHATIEQLALEHHIPITYLQDINSRQALFNFEKLNPDYLFVACFPWKLSPQLFHLPKIAALNAHPSMLPVYRGPQPVFWQLRNGEMKTGVSLHLINDEMDAGDIVLQTEVPLRPGMRGRAIDSKLGEFASKLFLEAMRLYQLNNINPLPQSWIQASYMPEPKFEDFEITTQWSARRAFMFMRGTEEWGRTYKVKAGDSTIFLKTAMAYSPSGKITKPYILEDNYVTVQFSPGLVNAYIESIS